MPLLPSPDPAPLIAQAPAVSATAAGVVRDAETGAPIGSALIQQDGTVTSSFSNPDGTFRLLLDRKGQPSVTVSAVGYEAVSVPVGDGQGLQVKLKAIGGFIPSSPIAPLTPLGASGAETAPLNSGLSFAYRLRQQTATAGAASLGGLANNDYRLGLRFRWRPFLVEAEGAHWETPIDVTGLPREENPAFTPSTWTAGARLGWLIPLHADLETAVALAYRWQNIVPNNRDIPYTGSDLDFEQTRHAGGLAGTVAWRPGRGPWHLEGHAGVYPLVTAFAKAPGNTYAANFLTDFRAIAGYEFVPGFRFGLGVAREAWTGTGSDASMLYSLNVHYTPGGVPRGNEP